MFAVSVNTIYLFILGNNPGQYPGSSAPHTGSHMFPHHVARCPAKSVWPIQRRALSAHHGLAPLVLPSDHAESEPGRLLLPGFPVGQGQRAQGRPEGGTGSGGGTPQQLSGHAGSESDPVGDGGVALRKHQAACYWR